MLKLSQADKICSLVLCFKDVLDVNRAFCDQMVLQWKSEGLFPLTPGQRGNSGSFSEKRERSDGLELILPPLF